MARSRWWWIGVVAVLVLAAVLRTSWLRADPPPAAAVGIVWHDEGAWTHNARNRVLWGVWRTDNWNPVFVAPVFTALEYGAFSAFGVGLWQARTVPVASGLVAIGCLMIGVGLLRGRRAALAGGALLATNYVFVMWNRAAMMETTMTACLVAAWAAAAAAERRAGWAAVAGACAALAWFTKAAAAFFVAALLLNAALMLLPSPRLASSPAARRAAWWTLAGLALTFAVIGLLFVLPHWTEYRFYNWQMSVTRKPEYSVRALVDRASWLPLAHDVFSRSLPIVLAGLAGLVGLVVRWPRATPAERLLVLWVVVGLAELVVHDSGNARRYVMFVPAFAALAALWLFDATAGDSRDRWLSGRAAWLVAPIGALAAYIAFGSLLRPWLQTSVEAGDYRVAVRLSAALALAATAAAALRWTRFSSWIARPRVPVAAATTVVAIAMVSDLITFVRFAQAAHTTNYDASVSLGRLLPAGTLVQGKLANGMALENRIKPIFIGNGFGNYEDRLQRDDIRFVLTYDLPSVGYESSDGSGLIDRLLAHYPDRAVVATFDVDETPAPDRAVLVDKFGRRGR
ncbi:MAG: glycosyltransferase family 39 protein [Acidobacteria bacterium]|nr:glycosyltransferase family 39 protein [Acidobacteriota bacterium]